MIGGVAVVVIGVGALLSISTIPANSVGIKYNKFSGAQEEPYSEGVYFKIPFVERFNVIDILGEKRNEVISRATEVLKEKFAKEGVELKSLTIKDMDAGEAIEKAISDEAVAKKAAETAKQKQEQAKADAETKRIQAQGEADANRILSESVTPELIQMKEAEARLKHGWVTVQGADAVVKE